MQRHATISLDKEILPGLSRRTALPWLRDAALDWAIILGALGVVHMVSSPVTWLLALLIIGNRQHALAILGHDGTHFTLSHDRRLNDYLTNLLAFWPLGLTVSGYRTLHFKHHKHTGTEDDPELGHKRSRNPQWDLPAKPSRILKYAVLDIAGGSFPDYLIILKYSKPDRLSEYLPLLCYHALAITLFAASGLWGCGLLWYAGLATTFMMFFRLRLWLEHQGTDDTQRVCLTWWQAALLSPHNSWHHWEHHKYPTVPYHRLPQARQRLSGPAILTLHDLASALASTISPRGQRSRFRRRTATHRRKTGKWPVPPDKPDERLLIEALCWQNGEIIDVSNATIITAARYARRTAMPAFLAAAMLPNYIAKGDPF